MHRTTGPFSLAALAARGGHGGVLTTRSSPLQGGDASAWGFPTFGTTTICTPTGGGVLYVLLQAAGAPAPIRSASVGARVAFAFLVDRLGRSSC